MNLKSQSLTCLVLALCTLCAFTTSCSTTKRKNVPLSATVLNENYFLGTFTAEFNASIFQLDKAVRRACARARLTKKAHAYRTSSCDYTYVDIDKIPVAITIKQLPDSTQIKLRVDTFGDEESSRKLAIAIDEELKIITQGPTPENSVEPVAVP